jgi:sensor histidine kinase YesM
MPYQVNRGADSAVEFKGLKAQYLFIAAGGLFGLFFIFVILRFTGLNVIVTLAITVLIGITLMIYVFTFSKKYGQHGFLKVTARKNVHNIVRKNSIKKILDIEQSNEMFLQKQKTDGQSKKHR